MILDLPKAFLSYEQKIDKINNYLAIIGIYMNLLKNYVKKEENIS